MFLNRDDINVSATAIKDAYGNEFSYEYLGNLAEEYKAVMKGRTLVMILCDYEMDTVAFYYCMLANHIVPILVDAQLDTEMIEQLAERYKPQYIWKPVDGKSKIVLKRGGHMLIETNNETPDLHDDLALLLTTSGSTGSPKLVRLSYNNVYSNAQNGAKHLQVQADDITITTLPFYYCYGLSIMHIHWHMGAAVCITKQPITSSQFWSFLKESKATNFVTVPYHYEILGRINFIEQDYPALRFITEGGGKLSKELQSSYGKALADKNIRFYILYGQTEGTALLSGIPYDKVLDRLESVGTAFPATKAEVRSANEDSIGELVFQGQSVSMGYAEKEEDLIKGDENQGVLYTGDLAYMDEEGYIYLKGRKKRFVKILGARVSLDEMENIIRMRYTEAEIVCSGCDNHIILYYEREIDEKELIRFCEIKFRIKKSMIELKKVSNIPRNSSGKVLYSKLGEGASEQNE